MKFVHSKIVTSHAINYINISRISIVRIVFVCRQLKRRLRKLLLLETFSVKGTIYASFYEIIEKRFSTKFVALLQIKKNQYSQHRLSYRWVYQEVPLVSERK